MEHAEEVENRERRVLTVSQAKLEMMDSEEMLVK